MMGYRLVAQDTSIDPAEAITISALVRLENNPRPFLAVSGEGLIVKMSFVLKKVITEVVMGEHI